MRLLRIELSNFRSFADCELDLNVDGLIAVVGDNGTGKSSIFTAVEWALYGDRRGQGAMRVRRDGCRDEENCFVELDFEVAGVSYRVRRVQGRSAKLTRLDTNEPICDGLGAVSRAVASTLGLTHEMFCATFYARQREVQALADSSKTSERRAQFERLLGIEQLRRAVELANGDARERAQVVAAMAAEAPDLEAIREEVSTIEAQAVQRDDVKAAQEAVSSAETERHAASEAREVLLAQQRTHTERRVAAEQAAGVLATEQSVLNGLQGQATAAREAAERLTAQEPVAGQVEVLTARERELDLLRQNHERAVDLRARQRTAVELVAQLADQLPPPQDGGDDPQALATAVSETAEELQAATELLRQASGRRAAAEAAAAAAAQAAARARRASEIQARLTTLGQPEAEVEASRERYHELRARRGEVEQTIAHAKEHRDAIELEGAAAKCGLCRRPYEDQWQQILADYEREISEGTAKIEEIDKELGAIEEAGKQQRSRAEEAAQLRAELHALGATAEDSVEALDARAATAAADLSAITEEEGALGRRVTQLEANLPQARERASAAAAASAKRTEIQTRYAEATREAEFYGQQLASVGVNGYEPDTHTEVRAALVQAQEAVRTCAGLRSAADSRELLEGRLEQQTEHVAKLHAELVVLREAETEVAVSDDQLEAAAKRCTDADHAQGTAREALEQVTRAALLNDQAVQSARRRLAEAKEESKRLAAARRDAAEAQEIAAALSAYREDAARRARPTIEAQTSLLLGRVTSGRYGQVRLTDGYRLEVADGRAFHPLSRFSGGEQDLASLCLRLSLSQTLAAQRGIETGFVILDEVFGSQDSGRRGSVLTQLRELRKTRFRQVFVIAHTGDVQGLCDSRIEVKRGTDRISVAEGPLA